MRLVLLTALLVATGCDGVFGLTHLHELADDASVTDTPTDARPGDGMGDALVDGYVQKSCGDLGYSLHSGSYYRNGGTQKSWIAAENDCFDDVATDNNMHTHLAVLTDDQEANNVFVNVLGSPSTGFFWIGLADTKTESFFGWVTDEVVSYPLTTTWNPGEPNGDLAENCAFFNAQLKLFDGPCTEVHLYACECDAHAVNPNNF